MWKQTLSLLCAITFLFTTLTSCGSAAEHRSVTLAWATDLHLNGLYLQPAANGLEKEEAYSEDGRVVSYDIDLLHAFVDQLVSEQPDYLILTGDLGDYGYISEFNTLAELLAEIEDGGVQVLVLPGNHDLYGDWQDPETGEPYDKEAENPILFREQFAAFGPDQAIAQDETSLSYVYELNSKLRILMLDADSCPSVEVEDENYPGCFYYEYQLPLDWIEEQLRKAQEDGVQMIAASHENLLVHNSAYDEYCLPQSGELLALYEEYGVLFNISGHMHIQHIQQSANGFTELLQSPLSLYPCRYGTITLTEDSMTYETESVDVESWAEGEGLTDENLLNFSTYALGIMDEVFTGWCYDDDSVKLNSDDTAMADYLTSAQEHFFMGRMDTFEWDEELTNAWMDISPDYRGPYLQSLRQEVGKNYESYRMTIG